MTTSGVIDIRKHSFSSADHLFLDTNVWLSVYGALSHARNRSAVYSARLRDMRSAGCSIFIDVLVVSEFVNTYARWEYNQSDPKPAKFKDFRASAAFRPVAQDIAHNVRRIIRQCNCCNSGFSDVDLEALLAHYGKGQSDFNDQMIAEICKDKNLALVTDDADFQATGLTILTANRRLLPQ